MAVLCPLLMYLNNLNLMFAYEENLNSLFSPVAIFQIQFRSENPETSIKKKNGKMRCFPQRTGNQKPDELFGSIVCI